MISGFGCMRAQTFKKKVPYWDRLCPFESYSVMSLHERLLRVLVSGCRTMREAWALSPGRYSYHRAQSSRLQSTVRLDLFGLVWLLKFLVCSINRAPFPYGRTRRVKIGRGTLLGLSLPRAPGAIACTHSPTSRATRLTSPCLILDVFALCIARCGGNRRARVV